MVDNCADYDFPPDNLISLPKIKSADATGRGWPCGTAVVGKVQEEIIKTILGHRRTTLNRLKRNPRASNLARRYAAGLPMSVRIAPALQWDNLQPKDQMYRCTECRQPTLPFGEFCYGDQCLLKLVAAVDGKTLDQWCKECWREKNADGGYLCGEPACFAEFLMIFRVTRVGADSIKWDGPYTEEDDDYEH